MSDGHLNVFSRQYMLCIVKIYRSKLMIMLILLVNSPAAFVRFIQYVWLTVNGFFS